MERFVIVSYDKDEEQGFFDVIPAETKDAAVGRWCRGRGEYASLVEVFTVHEFCDMASRFQAGIVSAAEASWMEVERDSEKNRLPSKLELGGMRVTDVTFDEGDVVSGTVAIAGAPHHMTLVKVRYNSETQQQEAVNDPNGHFDLFNAADPGGDGPFRTVRIEDLDGEWALMLTPFCT